jgi:DNA-binding transcriptional ArsR family regulator
MRLNIKRHRAQKNAAAAGVSLASALQSVGDRRRLSVLCTVFARRSQCVSDIAARLHMSVALTSHHLRSLAAAGLVKPVRDGARVCYRVSSTPMARDLRRFICTHGGIRVSERSL